MSDQTKITITGHGGIEGHIGRTMAEHDQLFAALAHDDPAERGRAVEAAISGPTSKPSAAKAEPPSAIYARMARGAQFPTRKQGRGR